MWARADMDGCISKFDVYQGKVDANETLTPVDNEGNKFGLGEQVVQTIVLDILKKNYEVYFDNSFTSVPLMENLKENGVNAAGTVRPNCKARPCPLIWKKILVEVSVTIVYQKTVLQFSSGKTTSLFLSSQTFMGQTFHL